MDGGQPASMGATTHGHPRGHGNVVRDTARGIIRKVRQFGVVTNKKQQHINSVRLVKTYLCALFLKFLYFLVDTTCSSNLKTTTNPNFAMDLKLFHLCNAPLLVRASVTCPHVFHHKNECKTKRERLQICPTNLSERETMRYCEMAFAS